jgi:TolB protein
MLISLSSFRPAPKLAAIQFAASLCFALLAAPAGAQLRIEITGVGSNQFPVAVAKFERAGDAPQEVDAIIRANLQRSGLFRLVDTGATPISENAQVALPDWKARGADALVIGSVTRLADGRFDVRYRLMDTVKQTQLDAQSLVTPARDLRLSAHTISDRIYEKLTGERGVFATRIAYVVQKNRKAYELQIADADGENPQIALARPEAIISPTWAPDGVRIAYTSFESGKAVVYLHTLTTGERRVVANFRGTNSAPAFAPDGKTMAVALTKDGLTQIYGISTDGSGVRRLTNSGAIDTEPRFSPDGKFIYFTSDRGGGPQIYRMAPDGSGVTRVTFTGDYNVTPRVSPDGKQIAYVSRRNGRFQVQVLDLASGQETAVTDTTSDESPSFAPNGRMLLYATEVGGRGVLALASPDGRFRARLPSVSGDVNEPTWGPFMK